jgi:oligoendopeptidase F
VLDEALFQNAIDRPTLDAMMGAAREAFPDFRRYFRAKARLLGAEQLAFYDLFRAGRDDDSTWSWDDAWTFVAEQFGTYSDKLKQLVLTSVEERWIDVGPRPGKGGGAFCMPIGDGKSRVLHNFGGNFDGVSTLAHELGHAYHNLCQANVPPLRAEGTPMTLAETASTFCETILHNAAIEHGTPDEQLAILEGSLQDAAQIVVDITSRFLFEQSVFEQRRERTLSPEEFCAMMTSAQLETYGDGLNADTLHPYMWAVKSHYYSPTAAYYNYPYMFGLLFGLGLYARYQEDPAGFKAGYDDLLAATGDADAATLAVRFGIDNHHRRVLESQPRPDSPADRHVRGVGRPTSGCARLISLSAVR